LNSLAETIQWPDRSEASPLASNEIHVWATTLIVAPDVLKNFAATLSPDE